MIYRDVVDEIRKRIDAGKFSSDRRLPPVRDLAAEFGISRQTADRVVATLEQEMLIVRLPRRGCFVRDSSRKQFIIGLADERYELPAFNATAERFRRKLVEKLKGCDCRTRLIDRFDLDDPMTLRELDALIVGEENFTAAGYDLLRRSGVPTVEFRGEQMHGSPFHQVVFDIERGFAELLATVKPSRFPRVFIVSEPHERSRFRRDTAERILLGNGYAEADVVRIEAESMIPERNYPTFRDLAKECVGNFIFTCGDFTAAGIIGVLMSRGLNVGRDVCLAGYDNLESMGFLPFGKPIITAVGYDRDEAAAVIAGIIDQLLHHPESSGVQTIVKLPTYVTCRETYQPLKMELS